MPRRVRWTAPCTLHGNAVRCTARFTLHAALTLTFALDLRAQVAPDLHWQTLSTTHFSVHFSPGLEPIARRAAGSAERAYERLARELHEPRGPIDIVVGDNLDVSNGNATPFPTNRITLWARPTVDATALKFLDDWIDLVVAHELTHIFHLDRTRGWWRLGQYLFGRNPFLFPGLYQPSWIAEGLAVHYESRLTGAGRLVGSDFATIARAQALDSVTPKLNALSIATPVFPLGTTAYVYGSQLVEYLARTRGEAKVRDFVEVSAGRTIPFLLNTNAKAAFGVSFETAYRAWADSVRRSVLTGSRASAPLRDLTPRGWFTERPRWTDVSHLVYGSNDGRAVTGLRVVSVAGGAPTFLARRNSLDVTSPLPNGARVFAQQEFLDAYTVRNDLYVEEGGRTRRLTWGARLMQPDARCRTFPVDCTPEIVAVQVVPGADRLVRVRLAGDTVAITPLTTASPDTVWSEPRWSRAGDRIAATRWTRGGTSEITILDSAGRVLQVVGRSRAVNSAPSWARGDSSIFFTSDRGGRSALYRARLPGGDLERIAEAATGLFEAEVSPDGAWLATLHFRSDGYHLAVVPATASALGNGVPADSTSVYPPSRNDPVVTSSAPVRDYSAWRSLLPRYWLPAAEQTDEQRTAWGFITSGSDVLDRHQYQVAATYEPKRQEPSVSFAYAFAGFGNPVLGLSGEEVWDHFVVVDTARTPLGTLARHKRFLDVALTASRPRARTNAFLTVGAEMEWRDFRTEPRPLIAQVDSSLRKTYTYPAFFASAGWSNTRRPTLAISAEDGIQVAASVRQRWRSDAAAETRSTSAVGTASAFKSLDWPGFAHHVLALHGAAGWADSLTSSEFSAGGVSGSVLAIAPGVTLGGGRRTFFARGFPAGVQEGNRALSASAEYRVPLALPASGLWSTPLFFQRVSAALFGDAATAWCPSGHEGSVVCPERIPQDWMASVGAELHLDAAYQYDSPHRFRLGVATPVAGRSWFGTSNVAAYFTVGIAF